MIQAKEMDLAILKQKCLEEIKRMCTTLATSNDLEEALLSGPRPASQIWCDVCKSTTTLRTLGVLHGNGTSKQETCCSKCKSATWPVGCRKVRWFKDGRPKANVGVGALDRDTLEDLLAAIVSAVGGGYVHGNSA
jgi:hypothetical protein